MKQPTIRQLELANPEFFSPELGKYGEITSHKFEQEPSGLMWKVRTKLGTYPVYRVGKDLSLDYVRHGW
jgi:hypothetical protein